MKKFLAAAAVTTCLFAGAPAAAQATADPAAYPAQEEDDEFPWGLLGLLGLAGLAGLKRRDRDDIRADTARRP
jgi:hypothetical protein